MRYNGADFTYTYKFNCQSLPQVNAYANAWLDSQGRFRIDYLPVGGKYVLVEKEAPEGYEKAEPIAVQVEERLDVQLHGLLNERSRLALSKVSSETGKSFPGRSWHCTGLTQMEIPAGEEYLMDQWISGDIPVLIEEKRDPVFLKALGDLTAVSRKIPAYQSNIAIPVSVLFYNSLDPVCYKVCLVLRIFRLHEKDFFRAAAVSGIRITEKRPFQMVERRTVPEAHQRTFVKDQIAVYFYAVFFRQFFQFSGHLPAHIKEIGLIGLRRKIQSRLHCRRNRHKEIPADF